MIGDRKAVNEALQRALTEEQARAMRGTYHLDDKGNRRPNSGPHLRPLVAWHPAADPPHTERNVLVELADGSVWMAWRRQPTGAVPMLDRSAWYACTDGAMLTTVAWWVDLPARSNEA